MEVPLSERRRVREVHKYCTRFQDGSPSDEAVDDEIQANLSSVASTKVTSPNTNLTALMQLIAWRLGMQRAMVSVVDENEQYFLAESTKTLHLEDNEKHEDGDALWAGCGSTLRSEALCANTIEVPRKEDCYACFSVGDLSSDPRFCKLPYVAGGPKFRFYAGTPLLTKMGVPIGSVFVIDTRPRGPPTQQEIDFLGVMARNVMEYLEMKRWSELLQRNDIMSRGLAALVEGGSTILDEGSDVNAPNPPFEKPKKSKETTMNGLASPNKEIKNLLETLKTADESSGNEDAPSRSRGKLPLKPWDNDMTLDRIFSRASNLLRESLDADFAIFFDTKVAAPSEVPTYQDNKPFPNDKSKVTNGAVMPPSNGAKVRPPIFRAKTTGDKLPKVSNTPPEMAQVLSFSTTKASSLKGHYPVEDHGFRPPELKRLGRLLRRHPTGKLWAFNQDGAEFSSGDDPENHESSNESSSTVPQRPAKKRESQILLECFPNARQVLFAPLWEAGTANEIAACFIVSLREIPDFRADKEPAFVHAYLNSVSVECSRVTMAAANRQKGDFISSISHELRSPLHGILASAELLAESRLDGRQKEFCDSIETCGRVLLKTIVDVLDYTKINNVSREVRKSGKASQWKTSRLPNSRHDGESSPVFSSEEFASSVADLAKLCEDSVNVVAAAHRHHITKSDMSLNGIHKPSNQATDTTAPVTVVVNIKPGSWNFDCIPGAIQRIIMNLAGNSFKYTQVGMVEIELSIEDHNMQTQSDAGKRIIVLKVRDTGKGISSDFLKNKIFTPFSQESTLASGTGLGLNMVKTLVEMQRGTIDVESQVGNGTNIVVKLPLPKISQSPSCPPPLVRVKSYGSPGSTSENPMVLKRQNFALHGFTSPNSMALSDSVERYLVDWFEMSRSLEPRSARIIIVNEEELDECLLNVEMYPVAPQLMIVCHQTSQQQLFQRLSRSTVGGELLTMPFGPQKLAKVLSICLSVLDKAPVAQMLNNTCNDHDLIPTAVKEIQPDSPLTVPSELPIRNGIKETLNSKGIIPSEAPIENGIGEPRCLTPTIPVQAPIQNCDMKPSCVSQAIPIKSPVQNSNRSIDSLIQNTIKETSTVAPSVNEEEKLYSKLTILPTPGKLSNGCRPEPVKTIESVVSEIPARCGPRILCVDDNPINLRLLKTYMEKLKYKDVTCAEDGALAFDAVKRRHDGFDLIFMDLSMPITDGFESISLIRILETMQVKITPPGTTPPAPAVIVALTGLASQRDRDAAEAAGADHFVTKPLKFSALKELLIEWGVAGELS